MTIARTIEQLRQVLGIYSSGRLKKGFVPTMGALHDGHRSLLERSAKENDRTICSIFVNPTQFTNSADFAKYPKQIEKDLALLLESRVDMAFLPSVEEMYPVGESWHIDLGGLDTILEGKSRPGHFQGVSQVVSRFFELIEPHSAYFGQKDYQQFLVVAKMAEGLGHTVRLVQCPVVRQADGLALSSRNAHLDEGQRREAALIFQVLQSFKESSHLPLMQAKERALNILMKSSVQLDYLEAVDRETLQPVDNWPSGIALIAVQVGATRLIDNTFLRP